MAYNNNNNSNSSYGGNIFQPLQHQQQQNSQHDYSHQQYTNQYQPNNGQPQQHHQQAGFQHQDAYSQSFTAPHQSGHNNNHDLHGKLPHYDNHKQQDPKAPPKETASSSSSSRPGTTSTTSTSGSIVDKKWIRSTFSKKCLKGNPDLTVTLADCTDALKEFVVTQGFMKNKALRHIPTNRCLGSDLQSVVLESCSGIPLSYKDDNIFQFGDADGNPSKQCLNDMLKYNDVCNPRRSSSQMARRVALSAL
ncbi:hypothetical protein BC829DRAFT_480686 [Chytridium lagenaria]|nr:hypothetical protein BC829DRAFT_480686 [Chytridium lagenaria]